MKTKFTKGLIKGLIYYTIGFVATWLTYIVFGWGYKHSPGLHHIVALLFFLVGAGWTLHYFILLLIGLRLKVDFGVLTVHIVAILSVVLYVVFDIKRTNVADYKTDPVDIITINKDKTNGAASIVNGNGDTLYSQKGDTVLIDKIKSDTTNYR